jgi:hypothetical protein
MSPLRVGFLPGYFMGQRVRREGRWRFFAKHRWMLDLAGITKDDTVYARVLLKHKFSATEDSRSDAFSAASGLGSAVFGPRLTGVSAPKVPASRCRRQSRSV